MNKFQPGAVRSGLSLYLFLRLWSVTGAAVGLSGNISPASAGPTTSVRVGTL